MERKTRSQKIILLSAATVMMSLACLLTPTATPVVDEQAQLNTMVAETVAAIALQETATAAAQQQLASDTPFPSATIDPELVTPTETATQAATETPTVTVTSTPPGEDPKKKLGNPSWHDRFDAASHWSLYDSSTTKTEIKDGQFFFTMYSKLNYSEWTVSWLKVKDFYMEVTVKAPSCSGKDRYGLLFRAPDTTQGYIYNFSCDGSYRLSTWDGKNFVDLVKWTTSDHIVSGADQSNRMGVWVKGSKIILYSNGHLLTEVTNNKYSGESRFGLTIASANTQNLVVVFDDLMYWVLE